MKYAGSVVKSARLTVRNPFAVLLISLATTLSTLPFVTGILIAGPSGGLVGLWTTSLLLGFVAVGGARIATVTLEREVSLGTSYFWEGIRDGTMMGLTVGIGNFVAIVVVLILFGIPVSGILGMSLTMIGVYLLIGWFVLAAFALTAWASFGEPRTVRTAFTDGGTLILEEPSAAAWIVIQTIGWTLLSLPLIIAPFLLLPGFVQIVATAIVRRASLKSDSHEFVDAANDT